MKRPISSFRMHLILAIVAPLLLTGCDFLLKDRTPPPRARWQAAPGFSTDNLAKIAVLAENKNGGRGGTHNSVERAVEDEFVGCLLSKGYKVSARSDVDKVLEEIHFEQSGVTESGAAKLGRMLNASAVLIVSINNISERAEPTGWIVNGVAQQNYYASCSMSARLVSVEKAEILGISSFSGSASIHDRNDTQQAVVWTAKVVAEGIPAHGMETAPAAPVSSPASGNSTNTLQQH